MTSFRSQFNRRPESILFFGAQKVDANGHVDDFWMLVSGSSIVSTGSGSIRPDASDHVDVGGRWLVPGFTDLHGHGGGGHSFDGGEAEIGAGLQVHRSHGTTRSLISLVANPLDELRSSLSVVADMAEKDPLILGSHLEGPFLSEHQRGAHNSKYLMNPEPDYVEALLGAARASLRQITIAPELPSAMEAIDTFVDAGTVVAVGHSDASSRLARQAFDRGARLLTHTFNAMPGIHHRDPGPVVAAFEDERVILELILDGHHVHPDVAAVVFRSAPGRVALVSDAMAAAGDSDGTYNLGSQNVEVIDGIARLQGSQTIAGSTLLLDQALRVAINRVQLNPVTAVEALTLTPAKALGLQNRHGLLAKGYVADAVVLDSDWTVDEVWANGDLISSSRNS